MYSHPQSRASDDVKRLRQEAGQWLRSLRERRRLSQRELAEKIGVEYYTFISQLETGRGRIPPDRYRLWAEVLGVEPKEFVRELLRFYDPVTYELLFPSMSVCMAPVAANEPLPPPSSDGGKSHV